MPEDKRYRVVFFGADDFSVPSLDRLAKFPDRYQLLVVTYTDRPHRHRKKPLPTPVKEYAIERGLEIVEVNKKTLKSDSFIHRLKEFRPYLGVIASFTIIPSFIVQLPIKGIVNVHPSLLPLYRGAAPVNWAIINGESQTGVTTFLVGDRVDAGGVLLQKAVKIKDGETAGELRKRLSYEAATLLEQSVDRYLRGVLKPASQSDSQATPAPKIKHRHRIVDWSNSAHRICNLILGLSPSPAALTKFRGKDIKLLRAKFLTDERQASPGEIIKIDSEGIVVAGGEGLLLLTEVQPAGSKVMFARDFVNGYRVKRTEKFG